MGKIAYNGGNGPQKETRLPIRKGSGEKSMEKRGWRTPDSTQKTREKPDSKLRRKTIPRGPQKKKRPKEGGAQ